MADLPRLLAPLKGLERYEEHHDETHLVIFVRQRGGEAWIMYIGVTHDLAHFMWLTRRKARREGWEFTDAYHVQIEPRPSSAICRALVRHFRPVMNKERLKPDRQDREILKRLGLI